MSNNYLTSDELQKIEEKGRKRLRTYINEKASIPGKELSKANKKAVCIVVEETYRNRFRRDKTFRNDIIAFMSRRNSAEETKAFWRQAMCLIIHEKGFQKRLQKAIHELNHQ